MPLSTNGLWLAEIITPRSARIDWVSIATAGVGIGPTITTSMPTLVKPAISADFHHVARQPRVLADHHPVAVVAAQEMRARRLADPQRHRRRSSAPVGPPADPVRAEEFPSHGGGLSAKRLKRKRPRLPPADTRARR